MPLFVKYLAEFAFLPNSMKCCCTGLPLPSFHRINPLYPSYYDMKVVELLSLHKVTIHEVYKFLYIIAEVGARDTCLMTTGYLLNVKAELYDIQEKELSEVR